MKLFDKASRVVDHLLFAAALLPTFIVLGAAAVSLVGQPVSLSAPPPPQTAACQSSPTAAR